MVRGKTLMQLRRNKNLTQKEVSELLGIEQSTYCNWESDANDIKSKHIPKLAEIFEVPITTLFENSVPNIKIRQKNIDNKDNSINNSIVMIISDKDSVEKIMEIINTHSKK